MLKVYNTLSGEKEEFHPLEEGKVKIYVCGLTVQNYSHLGHIRSAVNYDVIRKYLQYKGYLVIFIQNFTDVNEKIVKRAKEENLSAEQLAEKYTKAYLEDIQTLNIERATHYTKATEHIDDIIKMVEKLVDKGYAYEVNGNVYFSVDKFEDYGKLSGRSLEEMQAGARIKVNREKKNPLDFALWKKAPDGEKMWDSPWGKGWPGWHIECSAMSTKYLGKSFDIHGGGTDLIFPHHENEIAQSEACTGETFARYWLHNGSVNLKGEKMSKSLGNFFTTRELLKKYGPDVIRYFLITKHYRSPIDFSLEELENIKSSVDGLKNTLKDMKRLLKIEADEIKDVSTETDNKLNLNKIMNNFDERRKEFEKAMDNDFNTAQASGILHELAHDINSFINNSNFRLNSKTQPVVQEAYHIFSTMTDILGLTLSGSAFNPESQNVKSDINELMEFTLSLREKARTQKNYELADFIRDKLQSLGYKIKDTPQGVVWEKESE